MNQSTKINLIGCDIILNSPSKDLFCVNSCALSSCPVHWNLVPFKEYMLQGSILLCWRPHLDMPASQGLAPMRLIVCFRECRGVQAEPTGLVLANNSGSSQNLT